jgi:hypothetical protein
MDLSLPVVRAGRGVEAETQVLRRGRSDVPKMGGGFWTAGPGRLRYRATPQARRTSPLDFGMLGDHTGQSFTFWIGTGCKNARSPPVHNVPQRFEMRPRHLSREPCGRDIVFALINTRRMRCEKEGFFDRSADAVIIADVLDEFSVRREIDFESVEQCFLAES